jgi:serine/threonine-protein kinase
VVRSGRSAEIWRATDIALGRTVAVRLMRAREHRRAAALAEFRAEARIAGAVSHPNIARVYDFNDACDDCPPYLVMEYVDGPSLARLLGRGKPGLREALGIIAQTAAGLEALHKAGLAHGKLRARHVLLTSEGTVKLIGLRPPGPLASQAGSARRAGRDGAAADLRALGLLARHCLPENVPPGVAVLVSQLRTGQRDGGPDPAGLTAKLAGVLRDGLDVGSGTQGASPPVRGSGLAKPPAAALAGRAALEIPPEPGTKSFAVIKVKRHGSAAVLSACGIVLAILVAASIFGLGGQHPSAVAPKLADVHLRRAELIGRPVGEVTRLLRRLDLGVRISWRSSSSWLPGRVIAVRPVGWVAPETRILVIAAMRPGTAGPGVTRGTGKHQRHSAGPSRSPGPHASRTDRPSHSATPTASPPPSGGPTPSSSPSPLPSGSPSPEPSAGGPTPSSSPSPAGVQAQEEEDL